MICSRVLRHPIQATSCERRAMINQIRERWHWITKSVRPRWWVAAFAVVAVAFLIACGFYARYDHLSEYWKGVATNTGAGVIDLVVAVIGFGLYERWRERSDTIVRLRERIEDVKRYDDERAHSILGAAIRGLAKFGITEIDLRGVHLSNFHLQQNGIKSIEGAVISDGLYIGDEMKNFARLISVDFSAANCNGVRFASGALPAAAFDDCIFYGASLVGAEFDGATIR